MMPELTSPFWMETYGWNHSYLATSWTDPATATGRRKLMENVPTMENAGKTSSLNLTSFFA
jgi:hypothetical protein